MPWNGSIATLQSFEPPAVAYGFDPVTVNLSGNDSSPFNASARLFIDSDGGVRGQNTSAGNATTTDRGVWSTDHPNEANGADYEVRITYSSGETHYTGFQTLGDWYTLDNNLQYNFSESDIGSFNSVYIVTIRDVATMTTINTLTVNVSLEKDSP